MQKYKVGAYLRLSKEEFSNEKESNSITNQRQIIDNYLKEHKEYKLFDMILDGKSRRQVADFLNDNDILTPSEYLKINTNKDMTVMKK